MLCGPSRQPRAIDGHPKVGKRRTEEVGRRGDGSLPSDSNQSSASRNVTSLAGVEHCDRYPVASLNFPGHCIGYDSFLTGNAGGVLLFMLHLLGVQSCVKVGLYRINRSNRQSSPALWLKLCPSPGYLFDSGS